MEISSKIDNFRTNWSKFGMSHFAVGFRPVVTPEYRAYCPECGEELLPETEVEAATGKGSWSHLPLTGDMASCRGRPYVLYSGLLDEDDVRLERQA